MIGHGQEGVALYAEVLQVARAVGGQRVLPEVALRPPEDAAVDVVVDRVVRRPLQLGRHADVERIVVVPVEIGAG